MMVTLDGHDNAIIGKVERCGQAPFLVYSLEGVLANLEAMGMGPDEAAEYLSFNIIGAWVGPYTPGVLVPYDPEWDDEEEDE